MTAKPWWICIPLLGVQTASAQEQVPLVWGAIWQPELPGREQHPSLLFAEDERAQMVERLEQEPWKGWWAGFVTSGYRSRPAAQWWLLGDEAAAQRARDDLVANPIWREATHGYLEPSSHRFADYIAAYDLLAAWDGLTDEDERTIRTKIAAEADYYYQVMDGVPGGANYGNQRTLGASALGMAALALCEYTDSPIGPARWLTRTLHEIRRDENFWFFRPGGLFVEGVGYSNYMGLLFVPFAIAYERATGKYLFEDERLREWLTFAAYQTTANGEIIPWGTCETGRVVRHYALLSNGRYGRDLAPLCHQAFNRDLAGPHGSHVLATLAHYDPDVPGELPPASRAFPESQTVVLREDWSHGAVAVWFAGKDGTWPLEYRYDTYSHGDAGHFVIAAWDEILAADSGYDHWKSHDYYGAEFHNVLLIDGVGPAQDAPGEMSAIVTEGPVRRATVTVGYQGCTVRRTVALVRGRYVLVADRAEADGEHDYAWQVRSTCPPDGPGTDLAGREITWPGLSADGWRDLKPGGTQLTTVVPPFAELSLEPGRWRPISSKPEFANQVAVARWRAASMVGLFALIPNLREQPNVSWEAMDDGGLLVKGPGWTDRVFVAEAELRTEGDDGEVEERAPL